jgi:uncharacterized protein YlxP (DUF503 family)
VPFASLITVELHFADNADLKGKRKELSSLRSALTKKFGASVAEVGHQDLWQRSTLALGLVGRSASELDHAVDGLQRYLESRFEEGVSLQRRLVSFEDLDP